MIENIFGDDLNKKKETMIRSRLNLLKRNKLNQKKRLFYQLHLKLGKFVGIKQITRGKNQEILIHYITNRLKLQKFQKMVIIIILI